jgi:hypothetical protein
VGRGPPLSLETSRGWQAVHTHAIGEGSDVSVSLSGIDALDRLADAHAASYEIADPFPHAVFDDFLPKDQAERAAMLFPSLEDTVWDQSKLDDQKFSISDEQAMPDPLRLIFWQLNSSAFLRFLEKLTGIRGIIPDPHLRGGGLHRIGRGGRLSIHCDFNWHKELGLVRRLNLLLFLNPTWQEEWGGHLELWNRDMTECRQRLLPIMNRCVIFTTSHRSFHGHPDPLSCPPARARRSLALYYYQSPNRDKPRGAHSTLYRNRPGEDLELPRKHRHGDDGLASRIRKRLRR